jgi:acetyl-CoA carboxylase carboxyl transferase subunit alpha
MDYARSLFTGFTPLAGDRKFGDDKSILGGPAWLGEEPVMIIGQEKGHDTQARIAHNFGMARPEGYRKAVRLMEMAERFGLPVISFIDTAGAYPGIEAEERGQSEAIARSIDCCLNLAVPTIALIIGEGGSGGAVAIAAANRVLMLEHAIYSVISPEGAASILWRDSNKAEEAAVALKITARDLQQLKIIDEIIPEPVGGAHRDHEQTMAATGDAIAASLAALKSLGPDEARRQRREKFLAIGRAL